MTEHFLTYEQALALKELGFTEPCMAYYHNGYFFNWVKRSIEGYERCSNAHFTGDVAAPLKSQFFRWLREEHNIHQFIKMSKSDHVWFSFEIYFEKMANGETPPVPVGHRIDSWLGLNLEFSTYEEAEAACIRRLLQIIGKDSTMAEYIIP